MIGVMIVDDEPYVRQMIRKMADWSSLSMRVAAEAYNGEVALRQLTQTDNGISLVITDLKMPVMDGLELITKALALRPDLQFIVISAYDDFHLVKEAFKLGARDYLLKSEMTREQLYNILSNMRSRIMDGGQAHKSAAEDSKTGSERDSVMLRESLLNRFLNGNNNVEDLKTLQKLLKVQSGVRVALMILRLIRSRNEVQITANSFSVLLSQMVEKSADALSSRDGMHFEIVQITPFEYCLLALYSHSEPASAIMKHLRSLHDSFAPTGFYVNSGLSHIATDFTLLSRLINEAKTSLEYCFIQGNGSLVRYDGFFDRNIPLYVDAARQTEALKKYLASLCLKEGTGEGINDILLRPDYLQACNIPAVKELYMKYHFILTDYAQLNGLCGETRDLLSVYETDLKYRADLYGLNRWLVKVVENIKNSLGGSSIVNQVKNYMEKHYSENISLHSVAQELNLNSSYLSRIFSQKEHTNFIDYLCRIRITKAIELLKTSNLKIYEICEKTGYSNPEHFSRSFKKITGKSPKQFMRSGATR